MDIEVTFPKKPKDPRRLIPTLKHYRWAKSREGYRIYFKVGGIPKYATKGDKVYYGWKKHFRGTLRILESRPVYSTEAKGLSNWDGTTGNFVISDANSWKELKKPIRYNRGFRSFRYHE